MKPTFKDKFQITFILGILITFVLGLVIYMVSTTISHINSNSTTTTTAVSHASSVNTSQIQNSPTTSQLSTVKSAAQQHLGNNISVKNNIIYINNNHPTIHIPKSASSNVESHKNTTTVTFKTKNITSISEIKTATNDKKVIPNGWHQMDKLPGKYTTAYTKSLLISPSMINHLSFNTNQKNNVVTMTTWTNKQYTSNLKSILTNLKKNNIAKYQVQPIYNNHNDAVATGFHIQVVSTNSNLDQNIVIPNVQGNIDIDYSSGKITQKTDKY